MCNVSLCIMHCGNDDLDDIRAIARHFAVVVSAIALIYAGFNSVSACQSELLLRHQRYKISTR